MGTTLLINPAITYNAITINKYKTPWIELQ